VRAVLLILLVLGASTRAYGMTDEQKLTWYLPTAEAQWPGSPCNGQEQFVLEAQLPEGKDGWFAYGTCDVYLAPGMSDNQFCIILTHELGHASGYIGDTPGDHSSDLNSIMYGGRLRGDYAPCVRRTWQRVKHMHFRSAR